MRVGKATSPSRRLATPKSVILGAPDSVKRTLAGFKSRWMIPREWAAWIARASTATSSAARRAGWGVPARSAGQALPLDEFERQVRPPFVLADLVDLHDMGMLEAGDRLRLAPEAVELSGRGVGTREQHLEGDQAVQPELPGLVDDPHSAPAQLGEDFIAFGGQPVRW